MTKCPSHQPLPHFPSFPTPHHEELAQNQTYPKSQSGNTSPTPKECVRLPLPFSLLPLAFLLLSRPKLQCGLLSLLKPHKGFVSSGNERPKWQRCFFGLKTQWPQKNGPQKWPQKCAQPKMEENPHKTAPGTTRAPYLGLRFGRQLLCNGHLIWRQTQGLCFGLPFQTRQRNFLVLFGYPQKQRIPKLKPESSDSVSSLEGDSSPSMQNVRRV